MKQKLSLMVVLLFAAVLQTVANNTYYYKSTVSKTGAGVIYATGQNSSATTAPSAQRYRRATRRTASIQ